MPDSSSSELMVPPKRGSQSSPLPVLFWGLMYLTQQRVALAMNAKCDTMRSIKKARHCVNSADHETQEHRLCLFHRVSQFVAHIK